MRNCMIVLGAVLLFSGCDPKPCEVGGCHNCDYWVDIRGLDTHYNIKNGVALSLLSTQPRVLRAWTKEFSKQTELSHGITFEYGTYLSYYGFTATRKHRYIKTKDINMDGLRKLVPELEKIAEEVTDSMRGVHYY